MKRLPVSNTGFRGLRDLLLGYLEKVEPVTNNSERCRHVSYYDWYDAISLHLVGAEGFVVRLLLIRGTNDTMGT